MLEYFEPENFVDSHRQSYKLIRNKVQLQSHTQKSDGFYYTYGQKRDRVGEDPHNRGVISFSLIQAPNSRIAPSLRKHPFLIALRRWQRFARGNVPPRETSPAARRARRNGCFRRLHSSDPYFRRLSNWAPWNNSEKK